MNGTSLTVVGVARKGFDGVQLGETPDIFVPVTMKSQMMPTEGRPLDAHDDFWLPVIARLNPGMNPVGAQAALQPVYRGILESDAKILKLSGQRLQRFLAKPLLLVDGAHGRLVLQQDAQEPLLVLMGMVGLVLLVACANLAGLLVARGEARRREIAVRLTSGASRWRLVRQLLTESLLVAIAGGAAGLALASWCLKAMVEAIPPDIGMAGLQAALDGRVLWFAVAVTLLTSALFGLVPALRATRLNLQATLKDQGASVSEGRANVRLRQVLIVAQVALTAVLLTGAGLLARTLINLNHTNLGMRTDRVLQFSVAPDLNGETPSQTLQFANSASRRIAALPGVRSATVSTMPMFSDDDMGFNITPEGYVIHSGDDMDVLADYVGPNYLSTLGIPLMGGREFTEADTASSQKVCIINQKLAQRFFAGRNPIGLRVARGGGTPDIEIVGVAADSKWDGARSDIVPFMYMPYAQEARLGAFTFYVRTERDPAQMATSLRSAIAELDPNLPVNNLRTLAEQVSESMFDGRLVALLSVSLALLAALL
ncbi:MAG TPA: ABC transporter permease, partial [Rudaea sp.]|nr:ABC transporter permease [Rudaea sp.]